MDDEAVAALREAMNSEYPPKIVFTPSKDLAEFETQEALRILQKTATELSEHVMRLRVALQTERGRNEALEGMLEAADAQAHMVEGRFVEATNENQRLNRVIQAAHEECKRRGDALLRLTAVNPDDNEEKR